MKRWSLLKPVWAALSRRPVSQSPVFRRTSLLGILGLALIPAFGLGPVDAHPLGNFTINHFARIEVERGRVQVRYVIDMAEISTLQELQSAGAASANALTSQERARYLERVAPIYAAGLALLVNGQPVALRCESKALSMPDGAGGLKTLRTEFSYEGGFPYGPVSAYEVRFMDNNQRDRIGWRELVVAAGPGISIFNSSAFGSPLTDELKAYPQDAIAAPLNERTGDFSFTAGVVPAGARPLRTRNGAVVAASRDRLAELISVPRLTPAVALLGLLIAAFLGSLHAMSPGHGKTIVGAYLVGSRGTARHAAFLGLTVTATHTAGVFTLGLVTLFASHYVVPERLYPILSFLSGATVIAIGLRLMVSRLRAAWRFRTGESAHSHGHLHDLHYHRHHHHHRHDHGLHYGHQRDDSHHHDRHGHHQDDHDRDAHSHGHGHHDHDGDRHGHAHHRDLDRYHPDRNQEDTSHQRSGPALGPHTHDADSGAVSHEHLLDPAMPHSHSGIVHSHMPPGADGLAITWRSLLALGVSGGLLPCPSALIVLLAAISLHRVAYGLLLVITFSAGLAGMLTSVGLAFLYAGRLVKRWAQLGKLGGLGRLRGAGNLIRVIPALSALVVALAGTAICYGALAQAGFTLSSVAAQIQGNARIAGCFACAGLAAACLIFVLKRKAALSRPHI